jgi:hypothetical protein
MAIQINASLTSRNKGELTAAVVKIESYRINKFAGLYECTIAMFKDLEDAANSKPLYKEDIFCDMSQRRVMPNPVSPQLIYNGEEVEYPTYITFEMYTPVEIVEEYVEDEVQTETYNTFDEEGNVVQSTREITVPVTKTRTVTKNKIDIELIDGDPYGWAYNKLKEALGEIFGAENLTDC